MDAIFGRGLAVLKPGREAGAEIEQQAPAKVVSLGRALLGKVEIEPAGVHECEPPLGRIAGPEDVAGIGRLCLFHATFIFDMIAIKVTERNSRCTFSQIPATILRCQ